jgi:uncharacterized protein (DUF697 family)
MALGLPVDPFELLRTGDRLTKDRDADVRILFVVEPDASIVLLDAVQEQFRPLTTSAGVDVKVVADVTEGAAVVVPDVAVLLLGSGTMGARASVEALRRIAVPTCGITLGGDCDPVADAAGLSPTDVFAGEEPIALIRDSLGPWIVERCADARLALAHNFPILRRAIAQHAVQATAMQNALIGAVAFFPGADMPLMTANQAKMLLQIAAAYGEPLGPERVRELAAVVGGAFLFRTVARQAIALVPGFGWAIKAGIGYTGTMAMGKAAAEYFEDGADLYTVVARLQMRAEEFGADVKARIDSGEGLDVAGHARTLAGKAADAVGYTTVVSAPPAEAPATIGSDARDATA